MPHGELHSRKKRKNYLLLALVFGWVALIWAITMIKISGG